MNRLVASVVFSVALKCEAARTTYHDIMSKTDAFDQDKMDDEWGWGKKSTQAKGKKPTDYKVEDSNMALVGSDQDKQNRKAAAQTEEAWKGVGTEEGVWVWRIQQFKVVPWKKRDYGKFYSGDSYIVLRVVKDPETEALDKEIFFWLGAKSSQDEQGTAAYKTVELDDLFDGQPTQHREVQGYESQEFSEVFPEIDYMEGGVESGFDPVDPTKFRKKLFIVRKTKTHGIRVMEVTAAASSLNQGDCFVLDAGEDIRTFCGSKVSPFERHAASHHAEKLEAERMALGSADAKNTVEDSGEPSEEFWTLLGGQGEIAEDFDDNLLHQKPFGEGVLYKLSQGDAPEGQIGQLTLAKVGNGDLTKSMLKSDDVFMLDTGAEVFMWTGKSASGAEARNALDTALLYLKTNNMPLQTAVHMFKEGQTIRNKEWNKIFAN